MKLVLSCIECTKTTHATLPIEPRKLLHECGWLLSLVDPKQPTVAPLCVECAKRVYPDTIRAFAEAAIMKEDEAAPANTLAKPLG